MPELTLSGCRPEPAVSYLKALGVLRLVAEQKDPEALGWWQDEEFVLQSQLSSEDLIHFFLEEYVPTPIVAPWNKDSGFYRRDTPLEAIERSMDPRLAGFRRTIKVSRQVLKECGCAEKPGEGREKSRVVASLRARLPDAALRWLDAVTALTGDEPAYAPLFGGTGGVDGRLEFTRVFAECLAIALGLGHASGRRTASRRRGTGLRAALFGELESGAAIEATGGLLAPASVDAPNAGQGFVGSKRVNPWEYVLALEGALLLAGTVARRFGSMSPRYGAFPFTVEASGAGHASPGDEASRGEVWLPLWRRPMGLLEVTYLFREGRAEWRGRQAATAADMARAIVSLGVDRGLTEFRRFGIQARHGSGRSHLATPLGYWPVVERTEVHLLAEVDDFLGALREAARPRDAAQALVDAVRGLEAAILNYAGHGGRDRLQAVLLAVARAELTLARRAGTRPKGVPRPLPGLSPDWLAACDDGSTEFELAAAVASLIASETGTPGELRQHIEPVDRRNGAWDWSESVPRAVVWTGRDTLADLVAVLERRLVDAAREGVNPPLDGRLRVHPAAATALLKDDVDLERLGRLVEGLALIDWNRVGRTGGMVRLPARQHLPAATLPASYAVLKLALLGRPIRVGSLEVSVRPDAAILGLLRAGDIWGATVRAARRLRAVRLAPKGIPKSAAWPVGPDRGLGHRLFAALLVPVLENTLIQLALSREGEEEMVKEGRS